MGFMKNVQVHPDARGRFPFTLFHKDIVVHVIPYCQLVYIPAIRLYFRNTFLYTVAMQSVSYKRNSTGGSEQLKIRFVIEVTAIYQSELSSNGLGEVGEYY